MMKNQQVNMLYGELFEYPEIIMITISSTSNMYSFSEPIFSLSSGSQSQLEFLPAVIGEKQGDAQDESPVHHWAAWRQKIDSNLSRPLLLIKSFYVQVYLPLDKWKQRRVLWT